ncbi:hypothetical protein [Gordonia humi]|uniref:Uncharacterized protein n=1 Tax=Gordonia humi TaxID=686429 RepID=A0A840F7I9_9ACTN|nr:hypothetical protein [Gordonia humi]MBB4137549.1 hypothetical protein [Gordonia humi]
MPTWIPVLLVALLIVSAISLIMRRGPGRGAVSAGRGYAQGTLTVTSAVLGDPDKNGARNCTVTGTIVASGSAPAEVYGRIVLPAGATEPYPGLEQPVVYKPGKEDSTWRFGTLPDSVG